MTMTEGELIQAISLMLDKKLDPIQNDITGMKSEISNIKSDITGMKSEISDMKSDITVIKSEMSDMKSDITGMKSEISNIKSDVTGMKSEINSMKSEINSMKSVMATKTDLQETEQRLKDYVDERLHQSENMVLSEIDRVQEKTNEKFSKLRVL